MLRIERQDLCIAEKFLSMVYSWCISTIEEIVLPIWQCYISAALCRNIHLRSLLELGFSINEKD